jgi:hypothetical protein
MVSLAREARVDMVAREVKVDMVVREARVVTTTSRNLNLNLIGLNLNLTGRIRRRDGLRQQSPSGTRRRIHGESPRLSPNLTARAARGQMVGMDMVARAVDMVVREARVVTTTSRNLSLAGPNPSLSLAGPNLSLSLSLAGPNLNLSLAGPNLNLSPNLTARAARGQRVDMVARVARGLSLHRNLNQRNPMKMDGALARQRVN